MFGDDGGSLTIIRFSQPPNSLFKKDEVDSVQTLFWSNMDKHAEYAEVQYNQVDNTPPQYINISTIHSILYTKYNVRACTRTVSTVSGTWRTTRRW